jgi:acetoin utilization protein AcuC
MKATRTAIYLGPELAAYGFGGGHPFGTDRQAAFEREFRQRGLDLQTVLRPPVAASAADLQRFHTVRYVEQVRRQSRSGEGYLDYGDTPAFEGVYEAAASVAGSVLDAACGIMMGEFSNAFVPIAGLHHAQRDMASGFCVFNDIGVLIEWLRAIHGIRRVAYVDIDAHHGDGVFYAYETDPDVVFADLHEDGRFLYPGSGAAEETGLGEARGCKLNLPLPPGASDSAFHDAWPFVEAHLQRLPADFYILQCGADSVAGDPITHLQFSSSCHGYAAQSLRRIAEEHASGRLLALGGGGYDRDNLARAWCEVVAALIA